MKNHFSETAETNKKKPRRNMELGQQNKTNTLTQRKKIHARNLQTKKTNKELPGSAVLSGLPPSKFNYQENIIFQNN